MPRLRLCCLAASLLVAAPALADDSASHTFKTGRELLNAPQKFVGQAITITQGFCVYDEPNIVCFGAETPFEVSAGAVTDPRTLAALKENCGGDLPGKEHDPTQACAYTFSFVPTSAKIGVGDYVLHDLVQSNKRLVLFEADVIRAKR